MSSSCCVRGENTPPGSSGDGTLNHVSVANMGEKRFTTISYILFDQCSQSELTSRTGSGRLDVSHDSTRTVEWEG